MELINKRESKRYPGLFVHKYKNKVFYDSLWNKSTDILESRGRVYDSNDNVVINPLTKVFNYKENNTTIDDEELCICVDKINGFMGCATYVKSMDEVIVSTTGSLDSEYVDMAKEMMQHVITWLSNVKINKTFIFEICHPNDPHIIPENFGVYLLGVRDIDDNDKYFTSLEKERLLDKLALEMRVSRPKVQIKKFKEIKEINKSCKHEGYMVYGLNSDTCLKLKSPYYLGSKAIARKKDIFKLNKEFVDEEFYPLIDYFKEHTEIKTEKEKLEIIRDFFK